jgi:hypothetical protein
MTAIGSVAAISVPKASAVVFFRLARGRVPTHKRSLPGPRRRFTKWATIFEDDAAVDQVERESDIFERDRRREFPSPLSRGGVRGGAVAAKIRRREAFIGSAESPTPGPSP